jgi:hypothetical protein
MIFKVESMKDIKHVKTCHKCCKYNMYSYCQLSTSQYKKCIDEKFSLMKKVKYGNEEED